MKVYKETNGERSQQTELSPEGLLEGRRGRGYGDDVTSSFTLEPGIMYKNEPPGSLSLNKTQTGGGETVSK